MGKPNSRVGLTVAALLLASTSTAAFAAPAAADAAGDTAAQAGTTDDATDKREIIVTGVFGSRAIENAPISINVVSAQQLAQHAAVSAADLLKNVPGVFVNSSLGEIRNVVFSRGISANSLDAASGYYYVSLQEDGLPVELATANNFGPDYFLRPDLNLARVEGLRGGTAAITGPNAPGGIFNYISRTGKSNPGMEVQLKGGLQGDLANPYYRGDVYLGGKLNDSGLYYSIGGFYRWDRGSRDPGYAMNKGGQIHGNILYDYANGSLMFTAKYLDDHNAWNEFTPAIGATRIAPGFSKTSSVLPPANAAHCFPNADGRNECWDPTRLVHSRSAAFGLKWNHEFGEGWKFENNARYTSSKADWNTGALISASPMTDVVTSFINTNAFLPAGTINYFFRNSGQLATSNLVIPTPFGFSVQAITQNNLPNQNLLAGGIFTQVAFVQHYKSENFVDQATLTKDWGDHHLALGGYVALSKLRLRQGGGGIGFSTLTPRPEMLTATFTDATGKVFELTDPSGFQALGTVGGNDYSGTQHQYSVFFGDTWKVTPELTLDAGGRWESISYNVNNQTYTSGFSPTGADGNALTLYDNFVPSIGPVYNTRRSYRFFNFSVSAAYEFSSNFNAYVRYTNGKKAPDFGGIVAINTPAQIATVFPKPQKIQQVELGLKYSQGGINLQVFPFYSKLSNVTTAQTFTYTAGAQTGQFYSPPPVAGEIETYGVEMALSARITSTLSTRINLTLQSPKSRNFGSWAQGPKGDGTDDVLTLIAPGDADNNPKIIARGGLDWTPIKGVTLFGEVSHLGKRAANQANAFYLPAYTTLDLGASWEVTDRLKLQFNMVNVTNTLGVMSWSRSDSLLASIDRQGLAKGAYDPNGLYPILGIQPRAAFLSANYKF
ncbi:TonB-dependent receptor [Novosphingobium sp.]|uniref:TonB-dependent receptor n=1 Tax=Novosphingobium sp. TaxID=1874826 RepID=UPI001E09FB84|nr:TonB-dependent receptor [Novosphingobium sp.]MBX9665607.1 TonB-dependent receptor [Novosphingobium sp.]